MLYDELKQPPSALCQHAVQYYVCPGFLRAGVCSCPGALYFSFFLACTAPPAIRHCHFFSLFPSLQGFHKGSTFVESITTGSVCVLLLLTILLFRTYLFYRLECVVINEHKGSPPAAPCTKARKGVQASTPGRLRHRLSFRNHSPHISILLVHRPH